MYNPFSRNPAQSLTKKAYLEGFVKRVSSKPETKEPHKEEGKIKKHI